MAWVSGTSKLRTTPLSCLLNGEMTAFSTKVRSTNPRMSFTAQFPRHHTILVSGNLERLCKNHPAKRSTQRACSRQCRPPVGVVAVVAMTNLFWPNGTSRCGLLLPALVLTPSGSKLPTKLLIYPLLVPVRHSPLSSQCAARFDYNQRLFGLNHPKRLVLPQSTLNRSVHC
jgi:hypothetical protein